MAKMTLTREDVVDVLKAHYKGLGLRVDHISTLHFEPIEMEVSPLPIRTRAKPATERPRDEVFEELAELVGGYQHLTASARGAVNKAAAEIREVCPRVTRDDIRRKIWAYRREWPNAALTPTSLAKHWAALGLKQVQVQQRKDTSIRELVDKVV